MPHANVPTRSAAAERFTRWFARRFASPLQGTTYGRWRAVRRAHGLRAGAGFRGRAALTTLASLLSSRNASREELRFGDAVASAVVERPVFVLGHYRNGTTHLHNLLACDTRLCYPNYYQCNFPHSFLSTEAAGARLGGAMMMSERPMDRVALSMQAPAEDELALCSDTFLSPHMMWHFPAVEGEFRRYLSFRDATADERERFRAALARFARKLAVRYPGRPPVFKSPLHTARIPLLLETFPDARFVHIRRDPVTVYLSTRHMQERVVPLFQYQRVDPRALDDQILWRLDALYDAYLADRSSIPAGRLVEVSYDELTTDPIGTLRSIYDGLDLPAFEDARPAVERYVAGLGAYRRNRYPAIDGDLARRLDRAWGPVFDAFGYRRPAASAGVEVES